MATVPVLNPNREDLLAEHLHVRVFTTSIVQVGLKWTGPYYSPFFRLYYNRQAGASVTAGGQKTMMLANRLYIVPAWTRFTSHSPRPIDHCYSHFEIIGLPATVIRDVFSRPFQIKKDPRLDPLAVWWATTWLHASRSIWMC